LKKYFNFSRKEKIGVFLLSTTILTLLVILNVGANFRMPSPFEPPIGAKREFIHRRDSIKKEQFNVSRQSQEKFSKQNWAKFNPNNLTVKDWKTYGFSEKQALSIMKYIDAYGPLNEKQEFAKIYVVSEKKYKQLEEYIDLPDEAKPSSSELALIDLNVADTSDLTAIHGIGPYYASKIISKRNEIGGFLSLEMFKESVNLKEEVYALIETNCIFNPKNIQKVNVNTVSKKRLQQIPFMSWEAASLILKERARVKLTGLDFIPKNYLNEEERQKVLYYIDF
jgi:DNA uptake protein ComE-like DNA-binding protein